MARIIGRACAVLLLVLLQGCVEDDDGNGDAGGGGGGPFNDNDNEAPGAVIDIPAIVIAENQPLDAVRTQLETLLRDACGGEVCLTIEVAETDPDHETCQYSGYTDPPAETKVESGSTVTLIMGSLPCTDANGDGISDDNDDDGFADDTDGDGTPDVLDDDANGDGIPDAEQSTS